MVVTLMVHPLPWSNDVNTVSPQETPKSNSIDSTLAVDNLSEFWPNADAEDETLSVASLHDWFGERPVPATPIAIECPTAEGQNLDTDDLGECFDLADRDEPLVDDWAVVVSGDDSSSEIQNAALEFERFAAQFHAFATATIERPCVCQARPLVEPGLRK